MSDAITAASIGRPSAGAWRVLLAVGGGMLILGLAAPLKAMYWPGDAHETDRLLLWLSPTLLIDGMALVALAYVLRHTEEEIRNLKKLHPGAPWMWSEDWSKGTASSIRRIQVAALMVLVASTLPLLVGAISELANDLARLSMSVLWLLGVGLGLWEGVRLWKFGFSTFELATLPTPVGGELRGHLLVPSVNSATSKLTAKLECFRHIDDSLDTIWQSEQAVSAESAEPRAGGVGIPICFEIPNTCDSTTLGPPLIAWKLCVQSAGRIPWFKDAFYVPVFDVDRDAMPSASQQPTGFHVGRNADGVLTLFRRGPRRRFYLGPWQKGLIGAVIGGSVAGLAYEILKDTSPIFGFLAAGLAGTVSLGLSKLFAAGDQTAVTIDASTVRVSDKVFGFSRADSVPREEIASIRVKTIEGRTTRSYDIELVRPHDSSHELGMRIDDEAEARQMATELRRELDLS